MPKSAFAHVTTWVFDLDNTLYPRGSNLFRQIEDKMNDFVERELNLPRAKAIALRNSYWRRHGTTLAGLMQEHGIKPEPYLVEVHDIDYSVLTPDPLLQAAIDGLPGRKIIFTNGPRRHGEKASTACGLRQCFDQIYGIEDAAYVPKPRAPAFEKVFAAEGLTAHHSAMFEDDPVNLLVPYRLGLQTVLVGPEEGGDHVMHHTLDLTAFLTQLV